LDGRGTYKDWGKSEIPRRIMEERKRVGEPKLLRIGGMVEHLRKGATKNARDRQSLMGVLREAGTLCGL